MLSVNATFVTKKKQNLLSRLFFRIMRFYGLTLCIITLLNFSAVAQQGSHIDSKDIKKFITLLSADSLEGRGTGFEGQRKAANLIADRFKSLGLHPLDSTSYFEKFTLHQIYWNDVYIKTQNNLLENFTNMVFQGNHPVNALTEKEVIFGGTGTDAELNQIDVTDLFVLVFVDNLRSYSERRSFPHHYRRRNRLYEGRSIMDKW